MAIWVGQRAYSKRVRALSEHEQCGLALSIKQRLHMFHRIYYTILTLLYSISLRLPLVMFRITLQKLVYHKYGNGICLTMTRSVCQERR